jgi:glycerophosphoryl diester phosphodiesterase
MKNITIVGHRGARGEAPENTLAGFTRARELNLAEVELDVRLSKDCELIVLHDKTLARTTGRAGTSLDYSAAEMAAMDARHSFQGWPQKTGVPSLAAVLDAGAPNLHYQLEVKGESLPLLKQIATRLVSLIHDRDMPNRVVVTSGHAGFLAHMQRIQPELKRGYICQFRHQAPIRRARDLGASWLIPHYDLVTPALLSQAEKAGLGVSVWTVNDLAMAEKLVGMGATSLITDFPSAFRHHFGQSLPG